MSEAVSRAGRDRLRRSVAAASLAFSVFYITWRWGWTLNAEALWFSVPLVLAETYGLVTAFFLVFTTWSITDRAPPPPLPKRSVDVFVTVYDEPLSLIRKTVLAAREIHYPHATYILDDGRRDEVRTLAEHLGVLYLRRENNDHAKAGNLNNALRHTTGEFILQLDADHVPLPHIVDRLIGFFADERVAFAQSPQDFYNTDAFTYEGGKGSQRVWEDQQLFFRVLQPGKDRFNAAFFAGSCALIRRGAVDEIGGFATRSVTEDIETSLLLHARGWRSVYLNETLAYGLAPANARAFHVQHLRWGQGAMQVLRHYRPLRMPGLTLPQRMAYLDSLTTYLGGFQRLILYLCPIVFFVTGEFPLSTSASTFAAMFVPYIALQLASFKLLARGHGSFLLADRYAMAKFATHLCAIVGFLTRRRLAFRVTPKAITSVPAAAYAPQALLVLVTIASLGWAVYERSLGYEDEIAGWGASALWVNVIFALWNAAVAAYVVRMSLRGRQRRADYRFADALPAQARATRPDGKVGVLYDTVIDNLNPYGASLRCMKVIATGWRVEMTLPLKTRQVAVSGRVVHRQARATPYGDVYVHGVEFDNPERNVLDAIELHCAHHATPLERHQHVQELSNALRRRVPRILGQRSVAVGVPARIRVGTDENAFEVGIGLVETVSRSGARLLLDNDVVIGSLLQAQVAGSTHTVTGRVGLVHAFDSSIGTRFVAIVDTVPAAGSTSTHRWYDAIARFVMEHHMKFSKSHAISRISAEVRLLLGASTEPFPSQGAPVMDQLIPQRPDARTAMPTVPALLTVLGATARIEGKFQIAESIEVQCDISGELKVGGTLLIGERGRVSADVSTVNAVIRGTYTGNLKASGSVEIATSGRVTGTVESNELVIGKGAIFTGTVTHVEKELQEQLGTDITQPISDLEKPISRLIELEVAGNALGDTGKPARGRALGLS